MPAKEETLLILTFWEPARIRALMDEARTAPVRTYDMETRFRLAEQRACELVGEEFVHEAELAEWLYLVPEHDAEAPPRLVLRADEADVWLESNAYPPGGHRLYAREDPPGEDELLWDDELREYLELTPFEELAGTLDAADLLELAYDLETMELVSARTLSGDAEDLADAALLSGT